MQAGLLFADRGYDHDIYRDQVRRRRIIPAVALPLPNTSSPQSGRASWSAHEDIAAPNSIARHTLGTLTPLALPVTR